MHVYKEGDRNAPENYTGITLLTSTLKLFTSIKAFNRVRKADTVAIFCYKANVAK